MIPVALRLYPERINSDVKGINMISAGSIVMPLHFGKVPSFLSNGVAGG